MRLSFPKNHLARQVLGGLAGMAIASVVYVVLQQASFLGNSRAMLVDTPTIAGTSGNVRTNEANADPNELRKVAEQARRLAGALSSSPGIEAVQTSPVATEHVTSSSSSQMDRAERLALIRSQRAVMTVAAETTEPTQLDRIAFRNTVAENLRTSSLAPAAPASSPPETVVSSSEEEIVTTSIIDAASPPSTMQASKLPSSGLALNLLVAASLALALLQTNPGLRRRLTAMLHFQA